MNKFIVMALIGVGVFLLTGVNSALEDETFYQQKTEAYRQAYRDYIQAKMNDDPSAAHKLKVYNTAYTAYLRFLKEGNLDPNDPAGSFAAAQEPTPPADTGTGDPGLPGITGTGTGGGGDPDQSGGGSNPGTGGGGDPFVGVGGGDGLTGLIGDTGGGDPVRQTGTGTGGKGGGTGGGKDPGTGGEGVLDL